MIEWMKRLGTRPMSQVRPNEVPCHCLLQYTPWRNWPLEIELVRLSYCPRHMVWPNAWPRNAHDLIRGARA